MLRCQAVAFPSLYYAHAGDEGGSNQQATSIPFSVGDDPADDDPPTPPASPPSPTQSPRAGGGGGRAADGGGSGSDCDGDSAAPHLDPPEGYRCLRHRGNRRLRAGLLASGEAGAAAFAAGAGASTARAEGVVDMHPLSLPPPSPPPSPFFGKKETEEEANARRARAKEQEDLLKKNDDVRRRRYASLSPRPLAHSVAVFDA